VVAGTTSAVAWGMATAVVYRFRCAGEVRELLYERVTAALYTVLLDVHDDRATPIEVRYGGRRLYDAAALQRIYAACRDELVATQGQVPSNLEVVARHEAAEGR
jgi:hypothetical protein